MWDLPGPELEPVFPALAGGFLTPEPPGKPPPFVILDILKGKGFVDKRSPEPRALLLQQHASR